MTSETSDEELRDMALNRGLRLVKSRRRKPGSGDFGKFGLTDGAGTRLFGFGTEGLEASAEAVEAYLRKGSAETWQQSADSVPANSSPADPAAKLRRKAEPSARTRPKSKSRAQRAPADDVPAAKPEPVRKPAPEPKRREAELVVRAAKPADTARIAALLAQLGGTAGGDPATFRKAGGTVLVAELDELVGCAAFSLVPTLQHGPVGRISVLLVDDRHRRRGIGSRLLDAATHALSQKKCSVIEVMSDIDIRNAHGFLRANGFRQTSYRFARDAGARD